MGSSFCVWHLLWGIDCPGCGLVRSLVALVLGRFEESVVLHPLGIPLFLWLVNLWWLKKIKWSKEGQQAIGWSILVSLFVPWVVKWVT